MTTNALRLMKAKTFSMTAAAGRTRLVFRNAIANEMDIITRRAISERWHVGPYDFHCGFSFCPKGFFVGEIDGELVSHFAATVYPDHHSHMGGLIITEKFRNKGYVFQNTLKGIEACNQRFTIGGDFNIGSESKYEILGFERQWNSYIAMLNLDKIITNLAKVIPSIGVVVKPIHELNFEQLLKYDSSIFGTARRRFMEKWIAIPGSFGWAAVNGKNDIIGYAILKQVVRYAGTEIGLAMAPLFANNVNIAKLLLLTAANNCRANPAIPNVPLELFHPVGDNCGEDASELMKEVEAELIHIGCRMYTKGIPAGRELKKIYGIATPSFD